MREIKNLHESNVILAEAELNPQNYSLLWDNISPHGMSSPGRVSPDISCGDFSCGPGHGGYSLPPLVLSLGVFVCSTGASKIQANF